MGELDGFMRRINLGKEDFQLFYCFHVTALLFMSV